MTEGPQRIGAMLSPTQTIWDAHRAKMREKREAEIAGLPLPTPPLLDEGHVLVSTPEQARFDGYWKATKADGGREYRVGDSRVRWANGVEEHRQEDAWGKVTCTWSRGNEKWTANPPTPRSEAMGALPDKFRSEPWTTPNGEALDLSGKRGDAVRAIRKWGESVIAGPDSSLWIAGKPGRGKTQIARWLQLDFIAAGWVPTFRTVSDLQTSLRASYSKDPSAKADFEREMTRCEGSNLLILDDVGAEANAEDVRAMLFRIVDYRWQQNRPTLVTSNATPEQLEAAGMDGRLASRFGSYFAVLLPGDDFRLRRR
jgi:hypothetical protein